MPDFSFELEEGFAPSPAKSYEPLERGDYQCIVIETSINWFVPSGWYGYG